MKLCTDSSWILEPGTLLRLNASSSTTLAGYSCAGMHSSSLYRLAINHPLQADLIYLFRTTACPPVARKCVCLPLNLGMLANQWLTPIGFWRINFLEKVPLRLHWRPHVWSLHASIQNQLVTDEDFFGMGGYIWMLRETLSMFLALYSRHFFVYSSMRASSGSSESTFLFLGH